MSASHPESVVVVTPCSARKFYQPADAPGFRDLTNAGPRRAALARLSHLALPAREMYTGQHHRAVLRAVDRLRHTWPLMRVDLVIISAGYGVLSERDMIIPYDATFAGLGSGVARERAQQLGIRSGLETVLAQHEVGVILLSEAYLSIIDPPLRRAQSEMYFASPVVSVAGPAVVHVSAGRDEARRLRIAPRMVRAALFERFVEAATTRGWWPAMESMLRRKVDIPTPGQLAISTP